MKEVAKKALKEVAVQVVILVCQKAIEVAGNIHTNKTTTEVPTRALPTQSKIN
jgi:hypothetical protein